MAKGYCGACAKICLLIFIVLFWLSGGCFLVLGFMVGLNPNCQFYLSQTLYIEDIRSLDYLHANPYVMTAIGMFVFIVGLCGCCGAVREHTKYLGLYIFCMVLIIFGELSAGIFIAANKDAIDRGLQIKLQSSVINYRISGNSTPQTIDRIQMKYKCCGINNHTDYFHSHWFRYKGHKDGLFVPDSCCVHDATLPGEIIPIDGPKCQNESRTTFLGKNYHHLFHTGCCHAITDFVYDYIICVLCGCMGAAGLLVFGVVFAIWLCLYRSGDFD